MTSSLNSFFIAITTLMLSCSTLAEAAIISEKSGELVQSSQPVKPKYISYLTSWQLPGNATELLLKSKADAYMLSFAKWDQHGVISSSDDIIAKPSKQPDSIPGSYLTWTQIAHKSPHAQMIISFGGQDYEGIWDTMGNEDHSHVIANNIAELLMTDFPVYQESVDANCAGDNCQEKYQLIGHTQLSGVDFDFEQASRLTLEQNQQLAFLARRVRELVGNTKSIVLTTYHVGADPINCRNSEVTKNCSFREQDRSSHHGEVLSLLESTVGLFDFYNVMTYDAGRNYDYKTSIENYFNAVGIRADLRLGMSINRQWGPFGGFVMPLIENQARAKWQAEQGYGGFFVWALGANTESRSLDSQIRMFNTLVDAAKSADGDTLDSQNHTTPIEQ